MAINPETQFTGKINASDVDYPYGSARNITVPSDGTGTPFEAVLVNDVFGFQQAMLDLGGVVPSGTPEKVAASQYLQSLQRAGFFEWSTETTYPIDSLVKGSDGGVYRALSEQSANDPVSDGGVNWRVFISAALTVFAERFEANALDDAGTPDALFRVNRNHVANNNIHGFRDQTLFSPTTNGHAMANYDSAAATGGTADTDHTIGFQSRNSHNSSGTESIMYGHGDFNTVDDGIVTNMFPFFAKPTVNVGGSVGTIRSFISRPVANGPVTSNIVGMKIETALGGGAVGQEFGLFIDALTRGTAVAQPIFVATQAGLNFIGCNTQISALHTVGGAVELSLGGATTGSYPSVVNNYNQVLDEYRANLDAVGMFFSAATIAFNHAVTGVAGNTPVFDNLLNIQLSGASRGALYPGADNLYKLGLSGARWSEVFAGNGTINTSDEREKTELLDIDEVEKAVAMECKGAFKKYRFTEAVDKKGDNARIHFGIGAQTLRDIFAAHGLDAEKYSMFCYDEWDDIVDEKGLVTVAAGNRYGIRYDELFAFILAAM